MRAYKFLGALGGLGTVAVVLCCASTANAVPSLSFVPSFAGGAHLGEGGTLTAQLGFSGTEFHGHPEPLTSVILQLPAGTVLSNEGFPACNESVLEKMGPSGCPAASPAGPPGSFALLVSFGGETVEENGTVEAYFAPGGGVLLYLVGTTPVALKVIASGRYEPATPPFGPAVKFSFPIIETVPGAPAASFTSLTASLGAFRKEAGREVASVTLPTECPKGPLGWRADATFNDETGVHETSTQTDAETACPSVEEEAKRKAEAEAKTKAEAEAKTKAEAEAKTKAEAEAKTKAEAEAKRKAEAEAAAKTKAEEEAIIATLSRLAPTGKAAKLTALLKAGGYSFSFQAPSAGTLVISWYQVPKGAHVSAKAKPVLVATGRTSFSKAGRARVTVKLTAKGKRLLEHAKPIKLSAKDTFTPGGKTPISAVRTFVLKR